jgi:hypothetical protein
MVRLRVGIQNIMACWKTQLFASALINIVFRIMEFEMSNILSMGKIIQAEIVPKHIPYKVKDLMLEPIDD